MNDVNSDKIKDFLDSFKYPLYFLDYETYPKDFVNSKEQVPFQYSLHIQKEFDGNIKHTFYLDKTGVFPEKSLVPHLIENIGDKGSVLVWNKIFERSCNALIANLYPEYATDMLNINKRIVDLADPFKNNWLLNEELGNKWSLKKVYPLFTGSKSYNNLDINEGLLAQQSWIEAVQNNYPKDHKIFEDLEKYCHLDTYSMVEIHNKLKSLVYKNRLF